MTDISSDNSLETKPAQTPTTPKKMNTKRKAGDAAACSPSEPKTPKLQVVKTPKPPTPKGVQKVATPKGIPKSWDEADEADKMLFASRDQNVPWTEIRAKWKELTGENTGNSTLPNRYNRIKCNMMRLKPGHARILLEAKIEIEQEFEKSKWAKVADSVNQTTGESYQGPFIMKQAKDLEAKGGLTALSEAAESSAKESDEKEDETEDEEVKDEQEAEEGHDGEVKEEEVDDANLP